jgi:putative ABC transport system substrate-binding protein
MRRRDFIILIGIAASASSLAARAQHASQMRRIGVLMAIAENDPEGQARVAAFRERLRKLGWVDGRNIQIKTRWALPRDKEARQRFAKELIGLKPDVILSHATPNTATLLRQTRTIPIVFVGVSDPIGSGFVESYARPGGNATGFSVMAPTMGGKWVGLLKEIAPRVNLVTLLFNPATAPYVKYYMGSYKAAAASLALEATTAPVRNVSEIGSAIATHARAPNSGLVVMADSFTNANRVKITSLAARYHLPAIYPFSFYTDVGGLISYGIDILDSYPRAAVYVDRILKGMKPSELPIQSPDKFELVVNLKTAETLGLKAPLSLLRLADKIIE